MSKVKKLEVSTVFFYSLGNGLVDAKPRRTHNKEVDFLWGLKLTDQKFKEVFGFFEGDLLD